MVHYFGPLLLEGALHEAGVVLIDLEHGCHVLVEEGQVCLAVEFRYFFVDF